MVPLVPIGPGVHTLNNPDPIISLYRIASALKHIYFHTHLPSKEEQVERPLDGIGYLFSRLAVIDFPP